MTSNDYLDLIQRQRAFAIIKKRVSHAYLLVANDMIAMLGTAKLFAMSLVCKNKLCKNCADCNRVKKDIHPDIVCLVKDKILVDDVLNICDKTLFAKAESEYNVFVIADFAFATEQAQNKLLKVLEEPPKNTFFVLCATSGSRVLKTVKSRCIVVEQRPIDAFELKSELLKYYKDTAQLQQAINLSNGSLSRAIEFLDNPESLFYIKIAYQSLLQLKTSADILKVSRLFLDNKDKLKDIIEFLQVIFLDILVEKNFLPQFVLSNTHKNDIIELAKFYNQSSILRILDSLKELKERVVLYGNPTMVVDNLLFVLLECRYNARVLEPKN